MHTFAASLIVVALALVFAALADAPTWKTFGKIAVVSVALLAGLIAIGAVVGRPWETSCARRTGNSRHANRPDLFSWHVVVHLSSFTIRRMNAEPAEHAETHKRDLGGLSELCVDRRT